MNPNLGGGAREQHGLSSSWAGWLIISNLFAKVQGGAIVRAGGGVLVSRADAQGAEQVVRIVAPRKLTPTEGRIIVYLSQHEGESCTKAQIAEALGRNKKTIDRLIMRLRADGLIVSEPMWDERGGQVANRYRVSGRTVC